MQDPAKESTASGSRHPCLAISLQSVASHLRASDGREVPFTRAVLAVRNDCGVDVIDLVPNITLGQEGGTVQDVSGSVAATALTLPPGGPVTWDVYERLIPAHQGSASKIHMFGYRAVLNWRFDLAVSATYRRGASSPPETTPVSRWSLRWSVPDTSTGAVVLAIEEGKG